MTQLKKIRLSLHLENIGRSSNEICLELFIIEVCSNAFPKLKSMRLENAKNLLICNLIVNSPVVMLPLKS